MAQDADRTDPTAELNADSFERHGGSEFAVRLAGKRLPSIRLAAIVRGEPQAGAPRAEPFTLEFVGPEPALGQRIYELDHPELGPLEIFLVPIGVEEEGVRYEAVFN
jgi:hypothetical protein